MSKLPFCLFILLGTTVFVQGQCFITGADISYTNEILNYGSIYNNEQGNTVDPFELFASSETKMIRLRLWHTPSNITDDCGNQISSGSLSDVLDAAKKVKENGMMLKLAIHYSDYFADPSKQKMPAAWEGLSHSILLDSIANYTDQVLHALKAQNTIPEIISVGNETTWGFIDDTATTNGFDWDVDREKYNIALERIDVFNEENNANIKKAIHLTESSATWGANLFIENGVENFDMIGISYYPFFSPEININQVGKIVKELIEKHNKEVMIFETGFSWTTNFSDNYNNFITGNGNVIPYPTSAEGQKEFLLDLSKEVEENGGLGVIYWEPAWISSDMCDKWGQGSSYENVSMFDLETNTPLESFEFFQYCGNPVLTTEIEQSKIQVYPNPMLLSEFKITNIDQQSSWELSDVEGKVFKRGEFQKNEVNTIEMDSLPKGIYFLRITSVNDQSVVTKKIIF